MGILISVLFIITCVLLILVVLLQKGRGGGLGAALGGAGSAAFGTKVGDMMTWVTIVLTSMFLLLAIGGALYFRPKTSQAEKPTFFPDDRREITGEIRVTLQPIDPDDKIWYTTDGTDPVRKQNGDAYINAIPVTAGMTVKAISYPQRGDESEVATMTYRAPQPAAPVLSPMPNPQDPIKDSTDVTVEAGSKTDEVFYTLDGSEPTKERSRPYTGPISVSAKMTLKVKAFAAHAPPSRTVEATYGLQGIMPPKPAPTTIPARSPAPAVPPTTTAPAPAPAGL
jgi:protein translocase SecG subunit